MRSRRVSLVLALCLILAGVIVAPATASHPLTDPAFEPMQHDYLPGVGRGVAIADVNSDGMKDVLAATGWSFGSGGYKLFVYLQKEGGSLDQPYSVPLGVDSSWQDSSVDTGDLDENGGVDAVVATEDGIVLLYQTEGVLADPVLIPLEGGLQAEVGDVDGDGDPDIAASTKENGIFLLKNNNNVFTTHNVTDFNAHEIELGDVTGDGAPDIVAEKPGDNLLVGSLRVLVNDGAGAFAPDVYPLAQHVTGMGVGDVTGDGFGDVVISLWDLSEHVQAIEVFEQNQQGDLIQPETRIELPYVSRTHGVELGDMNGDGLTDVFVGASDWWNSILLQTSSGELMRACSRHSGDVEGLKSIALGDINSDTRTDAVVMEAGDGMLSFLRQTDPDTTVSLEVLPEQINVGESFGLEGVLGVAGGCAPDHESTVSITREGPGDESVQLPATTDDRGRFSLSDTAPGPGSYTYTASYAGDGTLPSATSDEVSIRAKYQIQVTLTSDDKVVEFGSPVTLRAHLPEVDSTNNMLEIHGLPFQTGRGPVDDYGDYVYEGLQEEPDDELYAYWAGDENYWPDYSWEDPLYVDMRVHLEHEFVWEKGYDGRYALYEEGKAPAYRVAVMPLEYGKVGAELHKRKDGRWKTVFEPNGSFSQLTDGMMTFRPTGLKVGRYRIRSIAPKQLGWFGNTSSWMYLKVVEPN